MKISTVKLQSMMSKVVKGVGNNKLIPITSLIGITLEDGTLTIVSTDGSNYLYVHEEVGEKGDFYVCVKADQFSKLVSKMTSDYIELKIKDNCLEVKGNGTYNIEIPLDENGDMVEYPNPIADNESKVGDKTTIKLSTVKTILSALKNGLSTSPSNPQLMNYYFGDCVVATNNTKINALAEKVTDKPILVNPTLVDLMDTITDDEINMVVYEPNWEEEPQQIEFVSDTVTVFGYVSEGVESFPINAIKTLIDMSYDNYCTFSKTELLQVLDRISLFVEEYDKGAVSLSFDDDGLTIRSNKMNSEELIAYKESHRDANSMYTAYVNVEMLQAQLKSQESDVVMLYFGLNKALKIVDGNLTFIIALIQKK